MNSRERVLAAMDRKPVDRVPTDIWAVPEVRAKLTDRFGGDYADALHIDGYAGAGPAYVGPALPPTGPDEIVDFWGIRRKRTAYATGEYFELSHHPLADCETIDDLQRYRWPEAEWFDYSGMADAAAKGRRTHAVQVGYMAPFTYHIYLRGLENALVDPLIRPDFTRHLLERLCGFLLAHHRRMFEACDGLIDATQVTDDYGMQTGPIMGMETFRAFYRPHLERFAGLAREFGIRVFHHDDGAIRAFLPDLLAIGIDLLNPIQWRCPGMEIDALKRDFGGRLCFHGGVDNQQTLPFGSEEDVRAEIRWLIDTLAADGTGYILAPCHNIQAVTPIENIIAMYDEAYRYGEF